MEQYLIIFSERLKALRIEKNLTQQELAEMIGTVKSTISQYESCKREPVLSILMKLANALDARGRWFKSSHSDQKKADFGEFPISAFLFLLIIY